MKKTKILALANQKGGVGKTTTAVNLGHELNRMGYRVLLIDNDPQGNLSLASGINDPDELEYTVADLYKASINESLVNRNCIYHLNSGIDLIPANLELESCEMQMITVMNREKLLAGALSRIAPDYDYVIIDCSPSFAIRTINALCACTTVIIPTEPHYFSMKGLEELIKQVIRVKKKINNDISIGGILAVKVDARSNWVKTVLDKIQYLFGSHIRFYNTQIPASIKADESIAHGMSVREYAKNNKVADAYARFAEEVIENG